MPYWICRTNDSAQPPACIMPTRVLGNVRIELAKITGITPPVFTFRGMCVDEPPYCRRPTTRLAYCTMMRRCPRSTMMMAAMTPTITTASRASTSRLIWPVRIWSKVANTARGRLTTMPEKMMSDMPLPMPRSVICSPSHMMNIVPVVRVIIAPRRKPQPGS